MRFKRKSETGEKSHWTLKAEPKKLTPRIQMVLDCEIAGWKPKQIREKIGVGKDRLNQIRASDLYKDLLAKNKHEVHTRILDMQAAEIAKIDPVLKLLKDEALNAAMEKVRLFKEGQSEFVRNSASSDVLDRAGYKPESRQVITSVEVTDEMAGRWEKTLQKRTKRVTEIHES